MQIWQKFFSYLGYYLLNLNNFYTFVLLLFYTFSYRLFFLILLSLDSTSFPLFLNTLFPVYLYIFVKILYFIWCNWCCSNHLFFFNFVTAKTRYYLKLAQVLVISSKITTFGFKFTHFLSFIVPCFYY